VQDAKANLHAVKRHAGRDEAPHRALDEMRHRLVGDAGGNDRPGDVGFGCDGSFHARLYRGSAWRFRDDFPGAGSNR
jgi:hypothetical protein